ncbi:fibrillarin-like rRNA/tRNA 2'-O-methyltransferase [Candidatus Woesearchaeota archaeon]|nr:fibrillarin-like rRNA/tRNA 2'-O-methyltransferase [Candidatus Woesearchaeota archaeon]
MKDLEETENPGIFIEDSKWGIKFWTKNLIKGKKVYDEKLINDEGTEYREWSTVKSKIGAALAKNICPLNLNEGDFVLYLGAASGTTVSHVSDVIGKKGLIFGIDIAPRVLRQLYFLAHDRKNIVPILADCNKPEEYDYRICKCDFLVQDIAQKAQVQIFLKNLKFLKTGGRGFLAIKARSIDVTKSPIKIFEMVKRQLEEAEVNIVDYMDLEPYEKDHCVFVVEK